MDHRKEFLKAWEKLDQAISLTGAAEGAVEPFGRISATGFVSIAQELLDHIADLYELPSVKSLVTLVPL